MSNLDSVVLLLLLPMLYYVVRIDRRTTLIKKMLDRRSIEYLKLEIDLEAIQNSLILLGRSQTPSISEGIVRQRDAKPELLKFVIEQGDSEPSLLRGLQLPDRDDDPPFGRDDILRRLGVENHPRFSP